MKLEKEALAPDFARGIIEIENRSLKFRELNDTKLIVCSQDHPSQECASKNLDTSTLIKMDAGQPNFKLCGEIDFEITETNHEILRKLYSTSHRYSKVFNYSSSKTYEISTNHTFKEIILCGLTLPGVTISTTELSRYLNSSLIQELRKEPYDLLVEQLRYSLATVENIIVQNRQDKEILTAFAPASPNQIRTIENG
jgi:hypothetical protein